MIVDQCRRLLEQLDEVAKASEREQIVKQLKSSQERLQIIRDKFLPKTACLDVLAKRTDVVGRLDGKKAYLRVVEMRKLLAEDPMKITKGRSFNNLESAFTKFSEQSTAVINDTWEHYKVKAQPVVDSNQLTQANQQRTYRDLVSQLKENDNKAKKASRTAPVSESDFIELEETWNLIRKQIESLPSASENPDVQNFLKAANSDGASLELLTEDVRQWLNDNKTADKYCIYSV